MADDDRAISGRLNMKHGFVKQIIRNQVSRDVYDKEVKVAKQCKKTKVKTQGSRESQAYYLPPRLRKSSEADVNTESQSTEESRDEEPQNGKEKEKNDVIVDDRLPLFKLEYKDESGLVHNQIVYKGENAGDIAKGLACETQLTDDLSRVLELKISENIQAHLERLS